MLTIDDLTDQIGVHRRTIERWIKAGAFPAASRRVLNGRGRRNVWPNSAVREGKRVLEALASGKTLAALAEERSANTA
jgi:predicted site-specific integrase-resolvase